MGQCFKLTVPRARGTLREGGTVGEMMLFATMDEFTVPHFVIPTASAQQASSPAVASPATPVTSAEPQGGSSGLDVSSPSQYAVVAVTRSQEPQNTFYTLPLDIHELIFAHLDDLADLTCVGLTSPYLWGVTQDIVHRHYRKHFGRLAGENIVFAVADTLPDDYPPALFLVSESKDLNGRVSTMRGGREDIGPLTLYNMAERLGVRYYGRINIEEKSRNVYNECLRRTTTLDHSQSSWRKAVQRKVGEICVQESLFVPTDQAWLLRNLTTKEFVTLGGIALDVKFIHGPFIKGVGFGQVLVSRTCWSSSNSISMCYDGKIHKGVWSGHCFNITTRGRHDESTKDEKAEWKDVSEDVASEIAAIWESEYGPGWREVAIERAERYKWAILGRVLGGGGTKCWA